MAEELAEEATELEEHHGDELPADLDLTTLELPYLFPNNNKRRLLGVIYFAIAAVFALVYFVAESSPLVNVGYLVGATAIAAFGVYSFISGQSLNHDELDALAIAGKETGFVVGHASAQLAWRGWSGRPTWRILLYSNEEQPLQRGLVFIDGVNGEVLHSITEDNPEDWSQYN